MNCLHDVIYGCILVTHVASQRGRKSRTSQSCTHIAAAIPVSAGCRGCDGSRLLYLPPSSLSISSTSGATETGCSNQRRQDSLYGEAFRGVGGTFTFIRQHQRHVAERYGESGVGGVPSTAGEAWVNDREVGAARFSWNIGLIVCYWRNWNRSMSYWYRTNDGRFKGQRIRRH